MTQATDRKKKLVHELRNWQCGGATNFTCQLFGLMAKADPYNLLRLTLGFPEEAEVYKEWFHSQNEDDFYEQYGVRCG